MPGPGVRAITRIQDADDYADYPQLSDAEKEAAVSISAGMAAYITVGNQLNKAMADAAGTSQVAGIIAENVSSGFSGKFRSSGRLTLDDWTNATGSATLTIGSVYWLSPSTAGRLTTTAPTTTGQRCVRIGRAISDDTLAISIEPAIVL